MDDGFSSLSALLTTVDGGRLPKPARGSSFFSASFTKAPIPIELFPLELEDVFGLLDITLAKAAETDVFGFLNLALAKAADISLCIWKTKYVILIGQTELAAMVNIIKWGYHRNK